MNFKYMKQLNPELARLEQSAGNAGAHGASWQDTFDALYESLSKSCGRGAYVEALQTAEAFEVARAGLQAAWAAGQQQGGEPVIGNAADVQCTFFDISEQYQ